MTGDPLRVLVLIDGLGWGGAEMLLADFAAAAPSAGIELQVGYLREKDGNPAAARLREVGIEPRHVPIDGLLSPSSFRSVAAAVDAAAPDVVHTHLGYADLLGGVVARRRGIPAVSTVHVMAWGEGLREGTKAFLFARVRRHCMHRVLAVSDAARAWYVERSGERDDRVVTVHNGVTDRAVPGAGAAVRRALGIEPDDVVCAMVSVLRPGKGHEVAIDAVARLRAEHPRLRLLVVGDGPSRADIEALAAPHGDTVVLAGHRDDVLEVLDGVDVLLHPSHADAFPTALLEAMAAGVPVVATAVGGIAEIVVPGETGELVPAPPEAAAVVEALGPLVGDAARRRRMGEAGRRRFEQEFSASSWAERLRRVYAEAVGPAPRRR
jgi:glycosyltransferase involved in cell wall biosynthesis